MRGATAVDYVALLGAVALGLVALTLLFGSSIATGTRCLASRLLGRGSCPATATAATTLRDSANVAPATLLATDRTTEGLVCNQLGCIRLGNCFGAGTAVATPGGARAIDTIAVGDVVLARDADSGELAPKIVTATKRSPARAVVALTVRAGGRRDVLHVTHEHPFRTDAGWTTAAALGPGAHVIGLDGDVVVEAASELAAPEDVFDLTVDAFHTFFVGQVGAWVHNDCAPQAETPAPPPPPETPAAQLVRLRAIVAELRRASASAEDIAIAERAVAALAARIRNGEGNALRYDALGRVVEVRYPNGSRALVTYAQATRGPGAVNVRSVEVIGPDGESARMYYRQVGGGPSRNRWFLDTGAGDADPEVFHGYVRVGPDGAITRHVLSGPRVTIDPTTGTTSASFREPIYRHVESSAGGGLRITVSQADNGVQISVFSRATGLGSRVVRASFSGGQIAPRIVREENGLVYLSLDGTDQVHAIVRIEDRPAGTGVAWSESFVPYYDATSNRTILRPLPSGTRALSVSLTTAVEQASVNGVVLPADPNYILPGRWRAEVRGQTANLEPRWGWVRTSDRTFVADTTSSARRFVGALETYAVTAVRSTPVVGGLVSLGEGVSGVEISGRAMSSRERVWHSAFAVLAIGLDFGPAVAESVQFTRAATGVERALGVSNAEARALLRRVSTLTPEEQALLRAAGAGRRVAPDQLSALVARLEGELPAATRARLEGTRPRTWSEAEALFTARRRPLFITGTKCFVAGTEVLVAEDEASLTSAVRRKKIEDVVAGDAVLTFDEERGVETVATVGRVSKRSTSRTRALAVLVPGGGFAERIETTDEHPFWVKDRGWVVASELTLGAELRGPGGASLVVVGSDVVVHHEPVAVYNFAVIGTRTYFVASAPDAAPVLVHNADCTLADIFEGVASAADMREAIRLAREARFSNAEIAAHAADVARNLPGGLARHGASLDALMSELGLAREYAARLAAPAAAAAAPVRPIDTMAAHPSPADVQAAMDLYARNPAAARLREPMTVSEFLGRRNNSANDSSLRVEFLRPRADYTGPPIVFLHTRFHGGDAYWNNRFKDVQLAHLFEHVGLGGSFAEAAHVPHEGAALVRWWNQYRPVASGPPPELTGQALREEIARPSLLSYIAGDADGIMHNPNNGGFALFRDAEGRAQWRGVVIDSGAAWNTPPIRPWQADVLGMGPVLRDHIPADMIPGLRRIAEASADDLVRWSRFPANDEGARAIVRAQRARAREVLDHYGIPYAR